MQMNKRYSIHSAFSSAFKDNNVEWIDAYLSTLTTKKINNTDFTVQDIIFKNSMNLLKKLIPFLMPKKHLIVSC